MAAWYEDEDFWRDNYEVMFSDDAFCRGADDVDQISSLGPTPPHRVLDLCCGPGRHTIPFAEKGSSVTAVDASAYLLDRARERALAAQVSPEFIRSDMRSFVRSNAYDLVLNLGNSFGYFETRSDDDLVIANMFESLCPGGVTVIALNPKELQARRSDRVFDLPDGSICVQRLQVVDEWSALEAEWLMIRGDSVRRYRVAHQLYSGFELRTAMEVAGFEVSLFGDFSGAEYGPQSARLVAVGRKPTNLSTNT